MSEIGPANLTTTNYSDWGCMLGAWTEVVPLFIVRWLAIKMCERVYVRREDNHRMMAVARPDINVRIPKGGTK
jgi:hypothetical protein